MEPAGPWPLTRVLTALGDLDVTRVDVARALGDRHGIPLIHSQQLRWHELDVVVEARHGRAGTDELTLELPPWDDVVEVAGDEAAWGLIDTVAAAADARFGSLGDGEAPEMEMPDGRVTLARQLRRHLALLLPDWAVEDAGEDAVVRRTLTGSGLLVVTA